MSRRRSPRTVLGAHPPRIRIILWIALLLTLQLAMVAQPAYAEFLSQFSDKPKTTLGYQIDIGERIRLTLHNGSLQEWTLVGMTDRALLVAANPAFDATSIPYNEIVRVERLKKGSLALGFLGGSLAGFLAGGMVTAVVVAISDDPYAGYWGVLLIPVGTLAGMVGGVILGSRSHWKQVDLTEVNAGQLDPVPGLGTGRKLRLTFHDQKQYEVYLVSTDSDSIRVRAEGSQRKTVAFGYDELASVEMWQVESSKKTSLGAVAAGGAIGLTGGLLIANSENNSGAAVTWAMGGLVVGAVVGGILGTKALDTSEWSKVFVMPQQEGVVVGYSTRF